MRELHPAAAVINEVKKAIVGKDGILIKVLIAILARGHILLEDIPGVGKTTMAHCRGGAGLGSGAALTISLWPAAESCTV